MKKYIFFTSLLLLSKFGSAQFQPSKPYYQFTRIADSLFQRSDYHASIVFFNKAISALEGKAILDDRYNLAAAWALVGQPDSSFFHLNKIVKSGKFYDSYKLSHDEKFGSLHADARWQNCLEELKSKKKTVENLLNHALIKRLDSLKIEDQKWRNYSTKIRNKEVVPGNLTLDQVWKNSRIVDSLMYFEIKCIFLKYGYPNFDLVGENGSSAFWLLVQHQDRHPMLQDSILVAMKIEVDKGKASAQNYAYLLDRVKVNTGKLQVYGTQMVLNEKQTSYQPQPLIDSEKVNERRASVGLDSIEAYIALMNSQYYGTLKKE